MGITKAGVTVKLMPEGTEIDFDALKETAKKLVVETYGDMGEIRLVEEPIAFGLKALKVTFIIDEAKGADIIAEKFEKLQEVASAQVIEFIRLT
jgi:elongation factor 1-beta